MHSFTSKIITMAKKKEKKQEIVKAEKTALQVWDELPRPMIKEATNSFLEKISSSDMLSVVSSIRKSASYLVKDGAINFTHVLGDCTTQISVIKKAHDSAATATFIYRILNDLNDYFNVSRKMTEMQLHSLAIEIVEELWSARLEEIVVFCHMLKKGAFIKVYERLDASLFWEAWGIYEQQKNDFIHNRHLDLKGSTFKEVSDNELSNKLGSFIGSFSALKDLKK